MIKCAQYTYKADLGKVFINSKKEKFPIIVVLNNKELSEYTEVSLEELKPKQRKTEE